MKSLEEIYKHGWIKDSPDDRDFEATRLIYTAMPLPTNYRVNPNTPIYNQGSNPSCVGHACAGVKSDEEFLQFHNNYLFDGLWLYDRCKKIDGIPNIQGTNLRCAMQILQQIGMRQSTLPCKKKNPDAFWQIGAYYRIDNESTDDFIKQIIFQYGDIALGSNWYNSWMDVADIFPSPDYICAGHAYRIDGWHDDVPKGWSIVNSWGKNLWGKQGVSVMPYTMFREYVLESGTDLWKLVDK